jgi:hypothetical protein
MMHPTSTARALFTTLLLLCYARPDTTCAQEGALTDRAAPSDWSWFIEQSARVFHNFGHTHVGAGVAFGARWRWLSFGIGGFYRPAAWSSHRTPIPVPDGGTYRGQATVGVGEQFALVGLLISPSYRFTSTPGLALDLPIIIGQGILGTPLQGADRDTPNGERVSEVEDWLFNGQDISFALGVDVGARATWFPWLNADGLGLGLGFSAGAHYTEFIAYDGAVYDAADVRSLGASLAVLFTPQ